MCVSNFKPIYNIYQCIYCSSYHKNITKYCNKHRLCYSNNKRLCCSDNLDKELLQHKDCSEEECCDKFCWIYKNIIDSKTENKCINCNHKLSQVRLNTIEIYKNLIKKNKNLYQKYKVLAVMLFCKEECYIDYIY